MKKNYVYLIIVALVIVAIVVLLIVFKNALGLMLLPIISFFTGKDDKKAKKEFTTNVTEIDREIQDSVIRQETIKTQIANNEDDLEGLKNVHVTDTPIPVTDEAINDYYDELLEGDSTWQDS